jgi:hypothetical protein
MGEVSSTFWVIFGSEIGPKSAKKSLSKNLHLIYFQKWVIPDMVFPTQIELALVEKIDFCCFWTLFLATFWTS